MKTHRGELKMNAKKVVGEAKHYVQIKLTQYQSQEQLSQMLQILDISANILYEQQRADNKFLSLINACISHELRNPLNSIIA